MMRRALLAALVLAVMFLAFAVFRRTSDGVPQWADCTSRAIAPPATVAATSPPPRVQTVLVATVESPTALAVAPSRTVLFVILREGQLLSVPKAGGPPTTLLDLTKRVATGGEYGLLGIAVEPNGAHLYLHYSDVDGFAKIIEYALDGDALVAGSERLVLRIRDPHRFHQGGQLEFGPDGHLYIGIGDGGSEGDLGDPEDDSQRLDELFGNILRIDPRPSGSAAYSVPADNPFVGVEGARPEVYAYGLRNPWRFSFDREGGDLWIGDVGHYCWEEVDHVSLAEARGANFGWRGVEALHAYDGPMPKKHVLPIWEYRHTVGIDIVLRHAPKGAPPACGVIGGYVYRGAALPALQGTYLYGDICDGRLLGLRARGDAVEPIALDAGIEGLLSFGEDDSGELYVLGVGGVFRLAPA
jgi:glucose/arabinose dehydrogenase